MIKAACLLLTCYLAVFNTAPGNEDAKLIDKVEAYYNEVMSNTRLTQKVKVYDDPDRGVKEGQLKGYYKKGKLVLLVNNYADGANCHQTVSYVIQNEILVLVDAYRQCAFSVDKKELAEYRQDKSYFNEQKLNLCITREGEGEDNAEKIQFKGQAFTIDDEKRLLDNLAFWRRFLDSELTYKQFARIRPYKF